MELEPIIARVKSLPVKEIRKATRDYCEIVLANAEVAACRKILEAALGPAFKEAGAPVTSDVLELTADFGEIVDHQVLFMKKSGNSTILAMLWAWRDDVHTTLVMGFRH